MGLFAKVNKLGDGYGIFYDLVIKVMDRAKSTRRERRRRERETAVFKVRCCYFSAVFSGFFVIQT